jgi:predicted esterase
MTATSMTATSLLRAAAVKAGAIIATFLVVLMPAVAAERVDYVVAPNDTDADIRRHIEPHHIVFDRPAAPNATLLVFLPGTGAHPADTLRFLGAAADAGYRAVGLEYNAAPGGVVLCASNPTPCSDNVHIKRAYGTDVTSVIDDLPAESILNRLAKLLAFLDARHPGEGWGSYLAADGPDWSRIAVSGFAQGAGLAAYIAKGHAVARVVLFSGPAENYAPSKQLAPWFSSPSATPADRWYGTYHQQEGDAPVMQRAYPALGLAPAHIRVLNLEPRVPPNANSYHSSVIVDQAIPLNQDGTPAYATDWAFILGKLP